MSELRFSKGIARLGTESAFIVLARAQKLAAEGKDIINLGIGQPDFRTPDHIVQAGIKALQDGHHGYTPANGLPQLRTAVAEDLATRHGADVNPDNVIVVPGGKPTMFFAILMFGEPGAEIIYPNPGFPIYESVIRYSGAKAVPMALSEQNGFAFDADTVLSQINERTRLIIINSPANPTGGVTPKEQIDKLLSDNGFGGFSTNDLLNYIREAIVAREYSKFVFTRSVSDILEVIACYSLKNGLSRDEISHVPLRSLFEIVTSSGKLGLEEDLRSISAANQEQHKISTAIRLPQLLFDDAGVYIVPFQVSQPNFITQKTVTGSCVMLESDFDANISLKDMIILIEGADPGFDWIFSQNIKALITKYGGANSHMAIRCAEFGIPAAIGSGEQSFEQIIKSNKVSLDCSSGLIIPIE